MAPAPPPTTVPSPPTTEAPAPTPTTEPAPPPTTEPAPQTQPVVQTTHQAVGEATWYGASPGTCASPWLPFGTELTVTNDANGATTTCVVDDREADQSRVVDLAPATFSQIAPLSEGVITVTLSW